MRELPLLGELEEDLTALLRAPFDAELMNAVLQGTEEEGEPGTVCAVFQKGYKIGDRVLRHAMVKVVAG